MAKQEMIEHHKKELNDLFSDFEKGLYETDMWHAIQNALEIRDRLDIIEGYLNNYLKDYPDTKHSETVRHTLEQLKFIHTGKK